MKLFGGLATDRAAMDSNPKGSHGMSTQGEATKMPPKDLIQTTSTNKIRIYLDTVRRRRCRGPTAVSHDVACSVLTCGGREIGVSSGDCVVGRRKFKLKKIEVRLLKAGLPLGRDDCVAVGSIEVRGTGVR